MSDYFVDIQEMNLCDIELFMIEGKNYLNILIIIIIFNKIIILFIKNKQSEIFS
jgi:hypothetical protein